MNALSLEGVSVRFGGVKACDDITLELGEKEILGIVGPNGSGKTTLFRATCGEVTTQGRVRLGDEDVSSWNQVKRARAGLVRTFQHAMVFPTKTVAENLGIARACSAGHVRRRQTSATPDIDSLLELAGLTRAMNTAAGALPNGMLRMLGLLVSMQARPRVLLVDEPAAGLNPDESARLAAVLLEIHRMEVPLVVIDHDMGFLAPLRQRLAVLDFGRLVMTASPAEVLNDEQVIRIYLGADFAKGK